MTDADDAVIRRLDRLAAILQLAFAPQIAEARRGIRADAINSAILDNAADGWVRSGELQRLVVESTGSSGRTVSRRIQDLLGQQALEQRGATAKLEYRSTGLL